MRGSMSYQFTRQSRPLESRVQYGALLAMIGISTIQSPSTVHSVRRCCRSQLWLYVLLYGLAVLAATAAYRAYPVTVLSRQRRHISQWCNIDVLLALF